MKSTKPGVKEVFEAVKNKVEESNHPLALHQWGKVIENENGGFVQMTSKFGRVKWEGRAANQYLINMKKPQTLRFRAFLHFSVRFLSVRNVMTLVVPLVHLE